MKIRIFLPEWIGKSHFINFKIKTEYNINIDGVGTVAYDTGNVVIDIDNIGFLNVTLESVYVNNTFISLSNFAITNYVIGTGDSIQLTISMVDLESIIGAVFADETLVILVRTEEGAQDIHEEVVRN